MPSDIRGSDNLDSGYFARTRQDFTVSRALNTLYTNTELFPIEVTVAINSGTSGRVDIVLDGQAGHPMVNGTGLYSTTTFTVMPSGTYQLNLVAGTPTIATWSEIR